MGDRTGDEGGADLTTAPIRVDVDGLADFRTWLGRELDANLRPGADAILNDHTMGVRFGQRNAGPQLRAARETYAASLTASMTNLGEYVNASEVLIDAIRQAVANYRSADLSAADSSRILSDILAGVFAQRDTGAIDQASETRREQHRMQPDPSA
jgi:hypothetical protein